MGIVKFSTDRKVNSTENNGYADGARDESLWAQDLVDTEIPESDLLPDAVHETRTEDREIYDEDGFEKDLI